MAKNKHLTDSERLEIEQWLRDGISIKQIAVKLDKSTSTISREIRAHALESDKYAPYRVHNRCIRRSACRKRQLCDDRPDCTRLCSACNLCNEVCADYEEQRCIMLFDSPYVCNVRFALSSAHCVRFAVPFCIAALVRRLLP